MPRGINKPCVGLLSSIDKGNKFLENQTNLTEIRYKEVYDTPQKKVYKN